MITNQIFETSAPLCYKQSNILGKQISFRVIGKSVPKQSAQFHVTGKGRKVDYVTGKITERYKLRSYQPDKVVNWHNEIILQSIPYIPETPFRCAVLNVTYVYCWTKTFPERVKKWMKENNFFWRLKRPDRDNLHKNTCDALSGKFWNDDSTVVDGFIAKKWGDSNYVNIEIQELLVPDFVIGKI